MPILWVNQKNLKKLWTKILMVRIYNKKRSQIFLEDKLFSVGRNFPFSIAQVQILTGEYFVMFYSNFLILIWYGFCLTEKSSVVWRTLCSFFQSKLITSIHFHEEKLGNFLVQTQYSKTRSKDIYFILTSKPKLLQIDPFWTLQKQIGTCLKSLIFLSLKFLKQR